MKRALFWIGFVIILGLIVWGLIASMSKTGPGGGPAGAPAPVTAADHVLGSASAPVTLIEYGDFECPACAAYAPLIEKLVTDEASTTLRLVFRHFPLPQHPNALIAAYASEAASDQGKFWDMYKLLYAGQNDWASLSDADARKAFDGYAKALNLDMKRFDADIDGDAAKQFVAGELAEGTKLGVDYTPSFFVNGKLIQNPDGYEALKAIIDAAAR